MRVAALIVACFCSIPIHLRCFATALRAPYPFWITEKQDQDSAGSDTDTTGGRGGIGQWILYRGLFAPPARPGRRAGTAQSPSTGWKVGSGVGVLEDDPDRDSPWTLHVVELLVSFS